MKVNIHKYSCKIVLLNQLCHILFQTILLQKKGNLLIRGKSTYLKNLQYYINYKPANPSSKSALITNSWFSTCDRSIVVSIISWNLAKSINTSWNIKINIWKPLKNLELEANQVTRTLFWFKQVLIFWANTFDSYSHS